MISAEELGKILKESPEQIAKYIAEYDLDNDGHINYEVCSCNAMFLSLCLTGAHVCGTYNMMFKAFDVGRRYQHEVYDYPHDCRGHFAKASLAPLLCGVYSGVYWLLQLLYD